MSSAFSGLKIPELSVDPAEVFKSDNPQLVSVLLDEFELQEQRPFFSGLIPEKQINIALKKSPQLKKLACHLLEAYEINGRRWKHADRRRVLEKAIRLLEKVSNELKGDIQKLENNVKESGKDSEELNKTREKHGEILADMGRAYLHRAKII
nr:Chain A, TPR-CHAT [Desulfonema magnum]